MTRRRWIGLAAIFLGIVAAVVWAASWLRAPDLDRAERVTLFSVDWHGYDDRAPATDDALYGCHILGKVEITDPEQRRELIAALREGIATPDVVQAKCFYPRHVLRVEQGGRTADYVICFQCGNYRLYLDGSTRHNLTPSMGRQVRPVFDKPLNDAKVPIAPL
jgi:hypothetical protein